MKQWIKDAVIYEIYPVSFCDANGDGIGDLKGITSKIPYLKDLGINTVWLNPCFKSPFRDGGYDVSDYCEIDKKFGTMADFEEMVNSLHAEGIRLVVDFVAGHTSDKHPWFKGSRKQKPDERYKDFYIWTTNGLDGEPQTVKGVAPRDGTYKINFYEFQPALNFGYGTIREDAKEWQWHYTDERLKPLRDEMIRTMKFYLKKGVDGFRVDMAASLVKNDDEKKTGTSKIWKNVREMFDKDYPECVLVSEWSNPELSLAAGFHCDFMLNEGGPQKPMYSTLVRDYQNHADHIVLSDGCFNGRVPVSQRPYYEDHSYFRMDSDSNIMDFITPFTERYEKTKDLLHSCAYSYGSQLLTDATVESDAFARVEQYTKAQQWFAQAEDYQDAQMLVTECSYRIACDLLEQEGNYTGAMEMFRDLGDYKDSATKYQDCMYQYCLDHLDTQDPTTMDYLTQLSAAGYTGAQALMDKLTGAAYSFHVSASSIDNGTNIADAADLNALYVHYALKTYNNEAAPRILISYTLPGGLTGTTPLNADGSASGARAWAAVVPQKCDQTGTVTLYFYDAQKGNSEILETITFTYHPPAPPETTAPDEVGP